MRLVAREHTNMMRCRGAKPLMPAWLLHLWRIVVLTRGYLRRRRMRDPVPAIANAL